jgi:L-asparaginase II
VTRVELHQAYSWCCDHCGRDNFVRAVTVELSEEDRQQMALECGDEDWTTGRWVAAPEVVTCETCGTEYETVDPGGEGEDS